MEEMVFQCRGCKQLVAVIDPAMLLYQRCPACQAQFRIDMAEYKYQISVNRTTPRKEDNHAKDRKV